MKKKRLSPLEARILYQKDKLLGHLRESGNISFACKRAGMSRETYYEWRNDADFAEGCDAAIETGKCFVNDLAHNHLVRNIQDGHMGAIKFHLMSCHPDYLRPRPPVTVPPVSQIEISVIDPDLVRAQIAKRKEEIEKAEE